MKNTKYIIFTILFLFVQVSFVYAEDDYGYSFFYKVDQNYNPIYDAKFEQRSLNGKVKRELGKYIQKMVLSSEEEAKTNMYEYVNRIYDESAILNLLTSEQETIINDIHTYDDYLRYKDSFINNYSDCMTKQELISFYKTNKGISVHEDSSHPGSLIFTIQTFMIIDEVEVPKGYQKETIILPIDVELNFLVNEDETLELSYVGARSYSRYLYKYNPNINYNKVSDFYEKMSSEYIYPLDCETSPKWNENYCYEEYYNILGSGVPRVGFAKSCSNIPVIIDKKGTINFEITTLIDGKEKVTSTKKGIVTISVKVKNIGDINSTNNIISSKIPNKLRYINDLNTDNTITFDSENNVIKWSVPELNAGEEKVFNYKVGIPEDVSISELYETTAIISADGISTPVVSDKALLDLEEEVVNPKTGDNRLQY